MANVILTPALGSIDQGIIFTCARAEDFESCNVHGLVITARCDIAQNKVPIYNYLPIVNFDDWIHRDGRIILCDRAEKDSRGKLINHIQSSGFSKTILDTQSPRQIFETLFLPATKNKYIEKNRLNIENLIIDIELINDFTNNYNNEKNIISLLEKFKGIKSGLSRELIQNKITGYYFLENISSSYDDIGYVVLLREVRHIPRILAQKIGSGFSKDDYDYLSMQNSRVAGRLSFDQDDFSMPVGLLSSPKLEHVLQCFSLLYTRVGVEDTQPEYFSTIWDRQPSLKE